jgi:molybdopterin-biosynthesis enzyme MoeA-like protein
LAEIGVALREARVVPDVTEDIVAAVNALRQRYTYVFTTGGIGPTHDDITVDAIAAAFGVEAIEHADARATLAAHYGEDKLTPARLRMARTPQGASLIQNPISAAPGIKIENVYILAGVPEIMRAMMEGVVATLRHGPALHSKTVSVSIGESLIAEGLGAIAARYAQIDIGSYPWAKDGKFGTSLVSRGADAAAVEAATDEIIALVRAKGVEPQIVR